MGVSVPQSTSTIMAEITLANGAEGAEEAGFLPGEGIEGEMPEQMGFLPGSEGKHYTFIPQGKTPLSEKVAEHFTDSQAPKESKSFEPKGETKHLSYERKEPIKAKEFQVQKSEKGGLERQEKPESRPATQARADQTGREILQRPQQHPPATRPQAANSAKYKEATPQKNGEKPTNKETKRTPEKSEARPQQKSETREQNARQQVESQTAREQEKTEEKREQQKEREEQEEGFAESDRRGEEHDDHPDQEGYKVTATENEEKAFLSFLSQDSSLLSELLNMQVNHFDVLVLFVEVMKLTLKGREQERMARMEERRLQLDHIQNMVDNFKQQGKWMLFANLGSGVLSIVSGIAPIAGHLKGEWILDKLSHITSKFNDMKPDKFFKGVTKMTFTMSEMYKSTGQIQNTFAESSRTFDQHMAEMRKTDWEEDSRTMEELKDQWKSMENFLHQSLQMYHDSVRQLYS